MNKILLVEDSTLFRTLIITQLKTLKFDIEIVDVDSLKKTKIICEKESGAGFDIAILDLILPDAHDGEIVDYVVSQNIPSIIMTANYNNKVKNAFLKKNVIDYIIKNNKGSFKYLSYLVNRIFRNRNINALVAEEDKKIRNILKNQLERQLLNVYAVDSGVEALEILKSKKITLLLTESYMSKMSGEELILKAGECFSRQELAILVLSNEESKENISKFIKLGANDYLQKPFSIEELNTKINTYIDVIDNMNIIKNLANKDSLTNLFNRRYFFDSLEKKYLYSCTNKCDLGCLMLDIDYFKKVNDKYGHQAGDYVLKVLAELLRRFFEKENFITARYGGEEIIIICTDISDSMIKKLSERLREKIQNMKFVFNNKKIKITVSIGCVNISENRLEQIKVIDDIVKYADESLYKAKNTGRNKVVMYNWK